jgi:hypothetical protein
MKLHLASIPKQKALDAVETAYATPLRAWPHTATGGAPEKAGN